MSAASNKGLVRRFLDGVINKGNQALGDELVASDFVDHSPLPGLTPDKKGFNQSFVTFRSAFPDLKYTIEDMVAEGDKVVVRWQGTGTNKGEMFGIAPTGKTATMTGIDIFRISKGKISELWLVMDQMGMMQQLGLIPLPK